MRALALLTGLGEAMLKQLCAVLMSTIIHGSAIIPPILPGHTLKVPAKVLEDHLIEAKLHEDLERYLKTANFDRMCATLDALGELYDDQGRYEDAERCYEGAIKTLVTVYGKRSSRLGYQFARLSAHYVVSKQFGKAEKANLMAIKILSAVTPKDELKLGMIYHNQAWLESGRSSLRLAEQHYKQCIALFDECLGVDHLMSGLSMNNLAAVYMAAGKYAAAEAAYAKAYKIISLNTPKDPILLGLLKNYAQVLRMQGKHSVAAQIEEQSRALKRLIAIP